MDPPLTGLVELPDFTLAEKLWFERKTTGAYFAGHPTDLVRDKVAHKVTHKVRDFDSLMEFGSAEPIIVVGLVKRVFSRPAFAIATIEDETGEGEVIFSRDRFDRYFWLLGKDKIILFKLAVRRGEYRSSMDCQMAHKVGEFMQPNP